MNKAKARIDSYGNTKFAITKWCKCITDDEKDWYRELKNRKEIGLTERFRLKDDDENIYAYGVSNNNNSFAPLDYYRGAYGVVTIEYYNKSKQWEQL